MNVHMHTYCMEPSKFRGKHCALFSIMNTVLYIITLLHYPLCNTLFYIFPLINTCARHSGAIVDQFDVYPK